RVVLGVFLLLVTNGLDKSIPWLLQLGVDSLAHGRLAEVGHYALYAILIAAGMWVIRAQSRIQIFNVGRDVEVDLRQDMLRAVHRLGPSFFERIATGDVMSRATNDLAQIRLLVGFGLLNVVNSLFAFTLGVGLMAVISPKLTLYALMPFPLFFLVTKTFARSLYVRSQ